MSEWEELDRLVKTGEADLRVLLMSPHWGALVISNLFQMARRPYFLVKRKVFRSFLSTEQAQDVAQKSYVTLWEKAPDFRKDGAFSTYAYGIVARHALNERRNRWRFVSAMKRYFECRDAGTDIAKDDILKHLEDAMPKMSEMQKEAIVLYLSGIPQTEAANIAGCEYATFRKRLEEARGVLRRSR